jgi:hypothetical protein
MEAVKTYIGLPFGVLFILTVLGKTGNEVIVLVHRCALSRQDDDGSLGRSGRAYAAC